MQRAFLSLYTATAERKWLGRAEAAAAFIDAKFRAPVGFVTAVSSETGALAPKPEVDENVVLVRSASLLAHHTGKSQWRAMAEHAMKYLADPGTVEGQGISVSGILLADRALRMEPAHLTIVGSKSDSAAKALYAAALRSAPDEARIEWLDAKEGPLPNPDVEYPELPEPAAFVCAGGSCSMPLKTPAQLEKRLADISHR